MHHRTTPDAIWHQRTPMHNRDMMPMMGRGHPMMARPTMVGHSMHSQLHNVSMQPGMPACMSMHAGMCEPTNSFHMGSGFDDCDMDGSSMAESARHSLGGGSSNARVSAQSDDSSDDRKDGHKKKKKHRKGKKDHDRKAKTGKRKDCKGRAIHKHN